MARPFTNSSSANKAFGVFLESNDAGDYIDKKKLKTGHFSSFLAYNEVKMRSTS